ncbi:uncharacterized protein HKW66_Vig0080570 [Vigna angularis]|uniref:Uncharacterized protein n=1 Tax=Phaseolus angularis TaxID=3914 RepID=A0A8T0KJ02_PHAAN|nr:uncharacterized protein HKW66_Vig0080570 [Vigna angularis]
MAMTYVDEDDYFGFVEDMHTLDGHKRHQLVVPSSSCGRKWSRKANVDAINPDASKTTNSFVKRKESNKSFQFDPSLEEFEECK